MEFKVAKQLDNGHRIVEVTDHDGERLGVLECNGTVVAWAGWTHALNVERISRALRLPLARVAVA